MLVKWFNLQYPKYKNLLAHIPNGQNVGPIRGAELRRLGQIKGFPDMILCVPSGDYPSLFVEMKAPKGRLHGNQQLIQESLREQGFKVVVCYSFDEAKSVVEEYLGK